MALVWPYSSPGVPWAAMASRTLNWLFAPALAAIILFIALAIVPGLLRSSPQTSDGPKATAQRIVVIAPNSAETICELGACDRIVGVSKFCVFPPQLLDKPRIGGLYDPDLERIVALRPDLMVLRGRSETLMTLAAQRGIAVYIDETDSLAGVVQTARDLGILMHLESAAERVVAHFEQRLRAIAERTQGRARPRVLVTISRSTDRLADILTAGKSSFLSEMIHLAGGTNIFGDMDVAYPQVSVETIIARRPDIIIELQPELQLTPEIRGRMSDQWFAPGGPFPAVQPRLFILNDQRALIPSPGYAEFIQVVSLHLHPEGKIE